MSVRYENWITVLYLISYLLHAVTSHRSATTLKPPTAEGNNIHPLVTMQCSAGRNKKNLGSWHSCGCFFSTNIQEKHRCTPSASRHGNGTPQGQCDQEPQGVQLNSKFPWSQSDWASVGPAGTSAIHGGQDRSELWWGVWRKPEEHWAGGCNVVADRCKSQPHISAVYVLSHWYSTLEKTFILKCVGMSYSHTSLGHGL